jgi:membrane peptidoglycan carboxypeptidase
VSNPDFSGPSWQERSDISETPDGSGARGTVGGYGRADADWPSTGASSSGYGPAGSNTGYQARPERSHRDDLDGYSPRTPDSGSRSSSSGNGTHAAGRGSNGDARYGRNGEAGYGASPDPRYGRNGDSGYPRDGDGYGRNGSSSRNGGSSPYGDGDPNGDASRNGDSGRTGRRPRARRVDGANSYQAGGRGTADYPDGDGYGQDGRRSAGYGSNGDAEHTSGRRSGGRSDRYGDRLDRYGRSEPYPRRPAGLRSGTGLVDHGPSALPDADGGYGGPAGPYGPGGPGGPYGPGGPGGPGRRGGGGPGGPGGGGGRRGPRGLVEPGRRPTRPPGGFWQRQWRASWWRRWTLKKAALVIGAMALGTVLILIAGFFYIYSSVQLPIKSLSAPLNQSSTVYFSDGKTEVGCFCTTNRTVLTATQLAQSKYLEQAFFAAEDRHFLTEGGISITGTARALLVDLSGSGYQGASTITEQYVKTYFQQAGGNLTYKEKLKEIIDAIKLAKLKDKQWILSHYLNAIYLGNGAYGVEAAAQTYFGKHAWQLDAAQAAMLAAMVQEPSAFDPRDPTKTVPGLGYSLLERWVYVLNNMADDTYPGGSPVLTQAQLHRILPDPSSPQADLKNFPKIDPPSTAEANWSGYRGYIMNAVRTELENNYRYKADQIGSAGLHITTTFSWRKMRALYTAVAEAKHLMRAYGQPLPMWARVGAVLENPKTGAIEAMYGGPNYTAKHCKKLGCQFDTALQARTQVGSSFKPYVLATAVSQGMNVLTSKLNGTSPLCVPPDNTALSRMTLSKLKTGACPPLWATVTPDNATRSGPVSVAAATAASSNPAYVDLAHRVGTDNVVRMAKSFGVNIAKFPAGSNLSRMIGETGIALGIASLTVEEQASTFATLANRGMYHTPHVIAKIVRNGQPIQVKVEHHRVLTPKQTADVDWALSFDTNSNSGYTGTGTNAVLSPYRPTIGKTGTTDSSQAAWFLGALPSQYSFTVGMFTANPSDKSQTLAILPSRGGWTGGYGGAWPATIWQIYMTKLLAMSHKKIAQLDRLNVSGMSKWIQAKALPKKQPKCKPFSFGHGHGHWKHGQPCPIVTPNPTPSGIPTPNPSPSGFPSPSPSGFPSPSPSPSGGFPAKPGGEAQAGAARQLAGHTPSRKQDSSTPSLTTAAMLPQSPPAKPGWAVATTGLA